MMSGSLGPPVIACAALASVLALGAIGCVPGYSPSGAAPTLPIRRSTALQLRFDILGSFGPDLERFVDWIVIGNASVVRRVRGAPTPDTINVQMFATGRPGQLGTCAVVMSATDADGALLAEHTFSHDCGWSSSDQPDFVTQTVLATIEEVALALDAAEQQRHAGGERPREADAADEAAAQATEPAVEPSEAGAPSRGTATRRRRRRSPCGTACPRAQRDENGCCP